MILELKKHFMSPYRKGKKITIDEYYQYIFEHTEGLEWFAARSLGAFRLHAKIWCFHGKRKYLRK